MEKLSVIIIAKNEEKMISDCIKSVTWADEILLIDNNSTDKTANLARKLGAKVLEYKNGSYTEARNYGLKKAKNDWIFYLDADERCTEELKKEIKEILSADRLQDDKVVAYAIPRRNFVLGKELKHGGWYPDYVKRLFMKNKLQKWEGELHEEPVFDGKMGHLGNPMIHKKKETIPQMVEKTNKWSEIEAKLMFEANHPPMNIPRFCTAMFREFWFRMIRKMAFLDGSIGIIFAMYQVYSRFISYAKLWEMQIKTK